MPLSPAANRIAHHIRDVHYRSFLRDDGLWDVEGELLDTKARDIALSDGRELKAGVPIHHMWIRTTIDNALVVQAIEVAMDSHPLGHCHEASAGLQKMVGCCMAQGWRKAIAHNLGGVAGCTHLRELLFNMATAAFQGVTGSFASEDSDTPPRHLGQCLGWDFKGPGVASHYPQFANWQPLQQAPHPGDAVAEPHTPA